MYELESDTVMVNQRLRVKTILHSKPILTEMLVDGLESGVFKASIAEATKRGVRKHWENEEFVNLYYVIARRVLSNIDPSQYVRNDGLIKRVIDGDLKAEEIAFLTPGELFPEQWQKLSEDQIKRENSMLEGDKEGGSDMFKCRRCGKSKTKYWEMQTRSADEPMTIFIRCLNCGKEWRQ
ncbi:MAG: hypothetical protein EBU01_06720 [Crocinitomicaceae bacterium]|nr:hypothetical protein [Crocinitomicaceae bacterium]